MWKAIGWGFAGLLLGVVLGGPMGAALGAVVGTLIGSVAGALHFHHHRSAAVCEAPRRVAGVVTGAAVGVAALKFALPVAEALALGVFAACAVSVVVLVRVLRPAKCKVPARNLNKAGANSSLRALPAGRRAIEQPRQVVNVITDARERISR